MELLLDIVICLFWGTFLLATVLGVLNEYRTEKNMIAESNDADYMEDDDPVFLTDRVS